MREERGEEGERERGERREGEREREREGERERDGGVIDRDRKSLFTDYLEHPGVLGFWWYFDSLPVGVCSTLRKCSALVLKVIKHVCFCKQASLPSRFPSCFRKLCFKEITLNDLLLSIPLTSFPAALSRLFKSAYFLGHCR